MITNNKKTYHGKRNRGFGLMDSLLSLAIFGVVLAIAAKETERTSIYKKANQYQSQALSDAKNYSGYLSSFNSSLNDVAKSAYKDKTVLEKTEATMRATNIPYLIIAPEDNAATTGMHKNIYGEKPCVLLTYDNSNSQDEITGFMYYSDKTNKTIKHKERVGTIAISFNPAYEVFYKKGITSDMPTKSINDTVSFNGWHPTAEQINYIRTNSCAGNTLSDDSIIVNLGMIPQFNNRLVAMSSVQNTADQSFSNFNSSSRYLPGHMFNNNTLKSNIAVSDKVLLQQASGTNQDVTMTVLDQGGTNNKVLNVSKSDSNDNSTALLLSGIQPTVVVTQGQSCTLNEVGKMAKSSNVSYAGKQLARNLVICTENQNLCSNQYCYLPFTQQKITFNARNGSRGLQGSDGVFMCPYAAPFAVSTNPTTSSYVNVDVIFNQGGGATGGVINNVSTHITDYTYPMMIPTPYVKHNAIITVNSSTLQLARTFLVGSNSVIYQPYLNQMNMINYVKGGGTQILVAGAIPITYQDGALTTPRGYRVSGQYQAGSCNSICPAIGAGWGNILSVAPAIISTPDGQEAANNYIDTSPSLDGNPQKCMCARVGGDQSQYIQGLAVVDNSFSGGLQSVTCSNVPVYNY